MHSIHQTDLHRRPRFRRGLVSRKCNRQQDPAETGPGQPPGVRSPPLGALTPRGERWLGICAPRASAGLAGSVPCESSRCSCPPTTCPLQDANCSSAAGEPGSRQRIERGRVRSALLGGSRQNPGKETKPQRECRSPRPLAFLASEPETSPPCPVCRPRPQRPLSPWGATFPGPLSARRPPLPGREPPHAPAQHLAKDLSNLVHR